VRLDFATASALVCGHDRVKNRKAAFQPFVIDTIRSAEALFIAGGDQSNYVDFWKNTPVEDAISFVAGPGGRHQRGHGHHERVRLLGHEQPQPRFGGRPDLVPRRDLLTSHPGVHA
jgi:hypothetical protein